MPPGYELVGVADSAGGDRQGLGAKLGFDIIHAGQDDDLAAFPPDSSDRSGILIQGGLCGRNLEKDFVGATMLLDHPTAWPGWKGIYYPIPPGGISGTKFTRTFFS